MWPIRPKVAAGEPVFDVDTPPECQSLGASQRSAQLNCIDAGVKRREYHVLESYSSPR